MNPRPYLGLLISCIVVATVVVVYWPTLQLPFLIDDVHLITTDARVTQGQYSALVATPYWPGPRGNTLWRPITSLSFGVNWAVSPGPWSFRLVNLLLHSGATLAVLLWLALLLRSRGVAALPAWLAGAAAALLWALHPLRSCPLGMVVDRAELSVACFGMLAVYLYTRDGAVGGGERRNGWSRWAQPVVAGLCWVLAVGSKEHAVTLLGVVLLFDLLPGLPVAQVRASGAARWWVRRALRCYVPMLVVVAAYVGARGVVLDDLVRSASEVSVVDNAIAGAGQVLEPGDSTTAARWGTPLAVLGRALQLVVWPAPLSWDYSYAAIEPARHWSDARVLLGGAALLAMLVGVVVAWRRAPLLAGGLAFLLITYSIVSNTFVLIGTAFAERFLHLPTIGGALVVASVLAALGGGRRGRGYAMGAGVVVALVLAGTSAAAVRARLTDFRSEATLNAADVEAQPRSVRLWCAAGFSAWKQGDIERALACAGQAREVYEDYPDAWKLTGLARWRAGRPGPALEALRRAFQLGATSEQAAVAAADIYRGAQQYEPAIALLASYVDAAPGAPGACNNLAWYLITATPESLRDPARALPYAERAVSLAPQEPDHWDTLASVLLALDRRAEAVQAFEQGLAAVPADHPYRADLVRKHAELTAP